MTSTIVLSPEARRQLDEIYDYIAEEASPAIALRFTDAILAQLEELRDFPNLGTMRDDIFTDSGRSDFAGA
ncbi:MAG TPA: type II toxin-antitoxin system RelE/ParE family toxin [Caulobacteraceae bacterium]